VPFSGHVARRADDAVARGSLASGALVRAYLSGAGGEIAVVAEKAQEADRVKRPQIRVIDPSRLQASAADRAAFLPFRELLEERSRAYLAGREPARPGRG
jgi:hypothetical protein